MAGHRALLQTRPTACPTVSFKRGSSGRIANRKLPTEHVQTERLELADGTPAAEGLPDTAWVAAALQAQGGTTPQ